MLEMAEITVSAVKRSVKGFLNRFGVDIHRTTSSLSVWDVDFLRWIEIAQKRGIDPNDLGDEEWATDLLDFGLAQVYGPLLRVDSTILEFGPGTGRLSRHLIGYDRHLIVVDRSQVVCTWMSQYLSGKGPHTVLQSHNSSVSGVESGSVDAVFAHGVFEHLDLDTAYWFLSDFRRVLKPGGSVAFNFNNATSQGGLAHLRTTSSPEQPSVFRFHAPAAICEVAKWAGFATSDIQEQPGRIAFAVCRVSSDPFLGM